MSKKIVTNKNKFWLSRSNHEQAGVCISKEEPRMATEKNSSGFFIYREPYQEINEEIFFKLFGIVLERGDKFQIEITTKHKMKTLREIFNN